MTIPLFFLLDFVIFGVLYTALVALALFVLTRTGDPADRIEFQWRLIPRAYLLLLRPGRLRMAYTSLRSGPDE